MTTPQVHAKGVTESEARPLVLVQGSNHSGGHGAPLVRVDMAIDHDRLREMVAVKLDEGEVPLVKDGELNAPVPKGMNEVFKGVEPHVRQTRPEPAVELVFHQWGPRAVRAGELEDEVAGLSEAATDVAEAVEGSDGAEE